MNIEKFVAECNRSPLFKRKDILVTKRDLKEVNFIRKDYSLKEDMLELDQIMFFIAPKIIKNEDPDYLKENRENKDLYHVELIKIHDNKKFIKKLRRELKMPYDYKGFKVLKRKNLVPYLRSYTSCNFEAFHPDFKKWFFNWNRDKEPCDELDKLFETTTIVNKKVFEIVKKALQKWKLPWRYYDAIEELILFNTLIPAESGIFWQQQMNNLAASHEVSVEQLQLVFV